ncbi:PIN domain-containing protein [Nesterenkonia alkaliphila]|uniref:PIN domain-containing protein n=1 Tax=Nesterenkonia alkaliphila TaxID=1463631 RepID=A0A7K1UGE1_9MICC|nr:PIN domain-containing protein [Nesterenkonia alkaliphila]MVT25533.1 PIN domain-containing protein [Nesterenkonia alkaliphila]GFZ91093.1 ribonuclease VapC [Nesterenkonia alkaliphila]
MRLGQSSDAQVWVDRIDRGLVWIATDSLLELGYSARSKSDWDSELEAPPLKNMPVELISPRAERRAVEVQGELMVRSHHRAVKVPDLLVAATAETAGMIVLHVDKDFDLIADVTGQAVERLIGDF